MDMPVFFYIDPEFLNDLNMKGIETITLSYTFFSMMPVVFFVLEYANIFLEARYDKEGHLKPIPMP